MKNLAIAFAVAASFFSFTGSVAMADTGCTDLQGLSGEYCPVKAKSSQMDSLLAQGCVQIARNGIVVATPYCPASMFEAVVVEASMAPVDGNTGSDDSDSDNGGVDADNGGDTEAGDTSSDGGDSGGSSEAGGTASDAGESSSGSSEASGTSSDGDSGSSN